VIGTLGESIRLGWLVVRRGLGGASVSLTIGLLVAVAVAMLARPLPLWVQMLVAL
jgi:hypothetical protein